MPRAARTVVATSTPTGTTSSLKDEPKPATAPTLLRRDALPASASKSSSKPHTLTPKFHWNLNHNALQWLTDDERRTLYELFRFYDSSFHGDGLPAIHCDRFLQLLRDAQLLATGEGEELQIRTVEKIFAQAVLGKLRAYLDADEQPALTFHLFSGALLNCAIHKFPEETQPENAFKRLVYILITAQPDQKESQGPHGLLQHSELAAIPTWSVHDLHGYETSNNGDQPPSDFLQRQVFQQVLTGLSHDKLADERLRERLETLYDVPEDVKSHFNAETVELVTERFRTFDVFDRGVLPRDEVFALLSGLAKKLEIMDVYEVLAVILAGDITADRRQMPRGSLVLTSPSSVKEVSLVMIFQALHVCRRSRSAAYLSSQAHGHGQQQHAARRVVGATATSTAKATGDNSERSEDTGKTKGEAKGTGRPVRAEKRAPGARGKAAAVASNQRAQPSPHKAHAGAAKGAAAGTKTQPTSGHHGIVPAKRSIVDIKREKKEPKATTAEQAALLRRLSKMSATSSEASSLHPSLDARDAELARSVPMDGEERGVLERADSFRSIHSSSSTSSANPAVKIPGVGAHAPTIHGNEARLHAADRESDDQSQPIAATSSVEHDVEPILTIWMFSKGNLGDEARMRSVDRKDCDGSICLTAKLCISATVRRIVITEGVYFHSNGDRLEVWNTQSQEIDQRMPLEGAVTELRQLVANKERDGFVLIPNQDQHDAMDKLQQSIRDASCPGYAMGLHTSAKHTKHPHPQLETPLPDQAYPLRRGGMLMKPSLDRGSTWVRQKSSSDLLAMLSDSLLQSHLKMKKRQSLLMSTNEHSPWSPIASNTRPELGNRKSVWTASNRVASPPPMQQELSDVGDHAALVKAWGLHHNDEWVLRLNEGLSGSKSLPMLPHADRSHARRQRPRELQPITMGTTGSS